jgi:Cd2+/Zn2+-exporting ATPase
VGTQLIEVGRPQGAVPEGLQDFTLAELRVDGERRALVTFADRVRPEARAALAELRSLGLRVVMLTGDREGAARQVARELDLEDFSSDLLPGDKLTRLEALQAEGLVAMVGDGVNDAPALAGADVGVAMGAAGTAVAVETADVALMSSDLHALARAVRIARRAETVLTQNIVFAVGVKVVFFLLAAAGLANMWMAILADTGAALLVTLNGMRLVGGSAPRSAPVPPAPVPCASGCCGGS